MSILSEVLAEYSTREILDALEFAEVHDYVVKGLQEEY